MNVCGAMGVENRVRAGDKICGDCQRDYGEAKSTAWLCATAENNEPRQRAASIGGTSEEGSRGESRAATVVGARTL